MRTKYSIGIVAIWLFATGCHYKCHYESGSESHDGSIWTTLLPWVTLLVTVILAFIGGRNALRQVKLNNISKSKLDRLDKLRAYIGAFLLRSNEPQNIGEVKQNLCALRVNLDSNSDDHKELHPLIKDYLEFIKTNTYDEKKVEEIVKEANKVFASEWRNIERSK